MLGKASRFLRRSLQSLSLALATIIALPMLAVAGETKPVSISNDVNYAQSLLTPRPLEMSPSPSRFYFDANTRICTSEQKEIAANLLAEILRKSTGYSLPVAKCDLNEALDNAVILNENARLSQDEIQGKNDSDPVLESYHLQVSEKTVEINAPTLQGGIWGVQTLLQLLGPWSRSDTAINYDWAVPAVQINDQPRTHWRALLIDPARSFIPVAEVKEIIDNISAYKYNRLHIHLSDDQGWRIEIPNPSSKAENKQGIDYSLLTKIGANLKQPPLMPGINNAPLQEGYYTLKDYQEIVDYAATRGIEILPEIDGPGHGAAILSSIPQMNGTHSFPRLAAGQKVLEGYHFGQGFSSLDPTKEATYEFMNHVIATIAQITPQVKLRPQPERYFHAGLDESKNTTVANQEKYRDRITAILKSKGLTGIQYNDMENVKHFSNQNAQYPEMIRHFWRNTKFFTTPMGKDFLRQQGKVIFSDASTTYLAQRQGKDVPGPWYECRFKTDYKCDVFASYNIDTKRFAIPESNLLGIEAALWGETVRTKEERNYLIFPRAIALAEVAWTPDTLRNEKDFAKRLSLQELSLGVQGINFYTHSQRSQQGSVPLKDIALNAPNTTLAYLALPGTKLAQVKSYILWKGQKIPLENRRVTDYEYGEIYQDYPYLRENNGRKAVGKITGRHAGSVIKVVAPQGIVSKEATLLVETPEWSRQMPLSQAVTVEQIGQENTQTLTLPAYKGHLPGNDEKLIVIGTQGYLFKDVPYGAAFYKDIYWLRSEGITNGYKDGTFRPQEPIERAAVLAFLYRLAGSPEVKTSAAAAFTDVPSTHPFYREILWGKQSGITTGWSDGSFRPHAHIERAAMVAFLERYCNTLRAIPGDYQVPIKRVQKFTDVPVDDYFFEKVTWAAQLGITTGYSDGSFRPHDAISREAMAAFIHRMVQYGQK